MWGWGFFVFQSDFFVFRCFGGRVEVCGGMCIKTDGRAHFHCAQFKLIDRIYSSIPMWSLPSEVFSFGTVDDPQRLRVVA